MTKINKIQINHINHIIRYPIIDSISFVSPYLFLFLSCFLLFQNKLLLSAYLIGHFSVQFIFALLRIIIKQPRPENNTPFEFMGHTIKTDKYGMPSGHIGVDFYSTTFIYLFLQNYWITTFYLIISLMTIEERLRYKNHTFSQVLVGALLGIFFGYSISVIYKNNIDSTKTITLNVNSTANTFI